MEYSERFEDAVQFQTSRNSRIDTNPPVEKCADIIGKKNNLYKVIFFYHQEKDMGC